MAAYSTQELENRFRTICGEAGEFEEDTLSRNVFELRDAVEANNVELQKTSAGKKILTKLTEIYQRLVQSAFLFQQEKNDLSIRVLLSELESLSKQTAGYEAIKDRLDEIIKYYQVAFESWKNADEELKQQLLVPKPQLVFLNSSTPKFYYINHDQALKIFCRNEHGGNIPKTLDGVRDVARLVTKDKLKDIYVKADPVKLNHLDIRGEEVWASFDVLMFGPETIASSMAAKLSCVWVIPKQNDKSAMDIIKNVQQAVPGLNDITVIERALQASEGVKGILLSEILLLVQSFNWLLKDIGENELRKQWDFFTTNYIKFDNPEKSNDPTEFNKPYSDFILSIKGQHKLPVDCQKFNLNDNEGLKQFHRYIESITRKASKQQMHLALQLMQAYPQLMAEHSLEDIVRMPSFFAKIRDLLPGYDEDVNKVKHYYYEDFNRVINTIPSLLELIDIENYSRQFFVNLKIPSDAKPDNHMVKIGITNGVVNKLELVSFDNNEAGEAKYELLKSDQSTMPGWKSVIFNLPQFKQKIAQNTRQEFLDRSEDFIFAWLRCVYDQEQNYERHRKAEIINDNDIYEKNSREPALNFNFLFAPAFIEGLERDIKLAVAAIKNNPNATHEDILLAVDPILARYYDAINKKSSWLPHKISTIYQELTGGNEKEFVAETFILAAKNAIINFFAARNKSLKETKVYDIIADIDAIDKNLKGEQFLDAVEKILLRYHSEYSLPCDDQPNEAQRMIFGCGVKMEHALSDQLDEQVTIQGENVSIREGLKLLAVNKNDPRFHKTENVLTTIQKFVDSRGILKKLPGDPEAWKTLDRIAKNFPFIEKLPIPTAQLNECWGKVIETDNPDIAKLLIRCGANANYVSSNSTLPPLFRAVKWPSPAEKVIDALLSNEKIDLNAVYDGQTVLFLAVELRKIDLIVKLVATHKVNLEKRVNGLTAMEYAMREDNWRAFSTLAQLGAGLSLDAKPALAFIKRHSLNYAWAMLKIQNLMIGWETAIEDMTLPISLGSNVDPEFVIEGVLTGKRLLRPELQAKIKAALFDEQGEPRKPNEHGLHAVPPTEIDNPILGSSTLFWKFNPNNPWADLLYMYTSLLLFKTVVSAPLDLFKIVHKGKVYVALVSLKGGEMELKDFVNNPQPDKNLNHLDPRYFAMSLIMAILFRLRDGKVDNNCANQFLDAFGKISWRFPDIDTEQWEGKPTQRDKDTGHRIMGIKSFLFCLTFMLKELDPDIIKELLANDHAKILEKMLNFLEKTYEKRCPEMFTEEDKKRFAKQPVPNNVKLDVLFSKGTLAAFEKVFVKIKNAYAPNNPIPRGIDLLCETTPVVGQILRIMHERYPNPENSAERYLRTYHPQGKGDNKGVFVTDVMGGNVVGLETYTEAFKTKMSGVNHSQKKKNRPLVSLELTLADARNELEIARKREEQVSSVKESLLSGDIVPFMLLTNDDTCQAVVDSIFPNSFDGSKKLEPEKSAEAKSKGLLKTITKLPGVLANNPKDEIIIIIGKVLKNRVITAINLADVKIPATILLRLIRNLPCLLTLNLTGCDVTPGVLAAVTENCLTLMSLILGGSDKLTKIGEATKPFVFTTLRIFAVSNCKDLQECHVVGTDVTHIQFENNPNLSVITVDCRALDNITITDCPKLLVEDIAKLVGQAPKLLNKILMEINTGKIKESIDSKNKIDELKKFFIQNPQVVAGFFRDREWTPELIKFLFKYRCTLAQTAPSSSQLEKFIQVCEQNRLSVEQLNLCGSTRLLSTSAVANLLKILTLKKLNYTAYRKPMDPKSLQVQTKKINIKHMAVAPNGEVFTVCNESNQAVVCHWDTSTVNGTKTDVLFLPQNKAAKAFCFTATGDLVVATAEVVNLYRVNVEKKVIQNKANVEVKKNLIKEIKLPHTKYFINTLLLMNNTLLIADKDSILVQPLDPKIPFKLITHNRQVTAIAQWTGTQFLTGDKEGYLTLWDYTDDSYLVRFQVHNDEITTVKPISSEFVAIGSKDNIIKIVDVRQRNVVMTLKGHTGFIKTLEVLQGDNLLISGDVEGQIKVWDLMNGECIYTLPPQQLGQAVTSFSVLPDGRVLSGSDDGSIRILSFANETIDFSDLGNAKAVDINEADAKLILHYEVSGDTKIFVDVCRKLVTSIVGGTKVIESEIKVDIDEDNLILHYKISGDKSIFDDVCKKLVAGVIGDSLKVTVNGDSLVFHEIDADKRQELKKMLLALNGSSLIFHGVNAAKLREIKKILFAIKERVAGFGLRASASERRNLMSASAVLPVKAPLPKLTALPQPIAQPLPSPQSFVAAKPRPSVRQDSPLLSRQGSADGISNGSQITPPSSPTKLVATGSSSSLRSSEGSPEKPTSSSGTMSPVMVRMPDSPVLPAVISAPASPASSSGRRFLFNALPTQAAPPSPSLSVSEINAPLPPVTKMQISSVPKPVLQQPVAPKPAVAKVLISSKPPARSSNIGEVPASIHAPVPRVPG